MIGMIHMIPTSEINGVAGLVKVSKDGRIRYSEEQRLKALSLFEQSGMTAKEFAHLHNIKYATFIRWCKNHRDAKESSSICLGAGNFVLAQPKPVASEESVVVTLGNGIELKASCSSGVKLLAELINQIS